MVSGEVFQVQTCGSCAFRWTSPRPSDEHIGPYYNSPDYLSHNNQKKTLFSLVYNTLRLWAAGQKVRSVVQHLRTKTPSQTPRKGAWLDVGCGIGVFLQAAKRQGYGAVGVELSESARLQASQRLQEPVYEQLEQATGTYQAITLWHVLEHLPHPEETLKKLWELAEPGAVLAIAVPNPDSWDAKHYGTDWAAWDVPIHFWHFNQSSVKTLLGRTGWKCTDVRPMWLDSYYVGLLSESFRHGRKRWLSAVQTGWISNRKGRNPVNTSSLVYWAQKEAI
jgi:SAM-dependent methyltransferase